MQYFSHVVGAAVNSALNCQLIFRLCLSTEMAQFSLLVSSELSCPNIIQLKDHVQMDLYGEGSSCVCFNYKKFEHNLSTISSFG